MARPMLWSQLVGASSGTSRYNGAHQALPHVGAAAEVRAAAGAWCNPLRERGLGRLPVRPEELTPRWVIRLVMGPQPARRQVEVIMDSDETGQQVSPSDGHDWSAQVVQLLENWHKRVYAAQSAHYATSDLFRALNYVIGIPAV